MHPKENDVLNYIKDNPFISQKELAEKAGLTSSAVASIVSNLVRKEFIQGQAYVLNREYPIVCVGAANVDRKFFVHDELIQGTSNPIQSSHSVGGVARNIGENLGRLGESVALITARGDDGEWKTIEEQTSQFINLDFAEHIEGQSTGCYTALISNEGEMEYGFADMNIYDHLTPEVLIKQTYILKRAKCIIADLNTPKVSLDFLCAYAEKYNLNLVLIPVSGPKMNRLPDNLNPVDWLIVNRDETEAHFNIKINSDDELLKAATLWNDAGVNHVIVTNGVKSLAYISKNGGGKIYSIIPSEKVVDVTGAGDSFSSAIVFGWLKGYPIDDIVKMALVNSSKTIETEYTVRQDLTEKQLIKDMEEVK
ncbi:carbohydrate kinase [Jeotgalicoccus coquinae]|uniref:Pseudouridine kinase n=1 Tax=Jeotgalicoccus coquinae TaxID=709509 RepID=A0A6V7RTL0_9STAP|nr:carbohydrate kinase [Jeotgalicoccus coquinae]MBB6423336.1 sugar/nucleoside kinase (ribokinase family) [Jeotgalicoccus coquinae]GGE08869.1 carbohydrate kinase [Jeotgalicoccus coquinae]CAD2081713.1 Pseudouridine kinase [Jeotgalicoccus coquinae]